VGRAIAVRATIRRGTLPDVSKAEAMLGKRARRLLADWRRRNAMLDQMERRLALIEEMNHRLVDLDKRLEGVREDAETVSGLSLSFQRFAAELTEHLTALTDELTRQAHDHGSSPTR
jgi:hypothetical protein